MTVDCDGPASINNNFTGTGSIGFPSAVMIANTWNKDLALSFGESIGKMADEMDVSGWYAPAMNTHRNALQDVILSIIQKMEFSPEKWLQTQ